MLIFMNMYCYIFFLPLTFISSLMVFMTPSWFSIWMIMEVNLISFICMMIFDKCMKSNLLMNYFLTQSFNSYLFLASTMLLNSNYNSPLTIMIFMTMITKMGFPPFYLWYTKLMMKMNWMNFLLMSTIQKLIPLISISNITNKIYLNMIFILIPTSMLYATLKGLNQTNLKLILTYSSIIQMSWILILLVSSEIMSLNYLMIYSIISLNLCLIFHKFNISNLTNLMTLKLNNKNNFYLIILMILSLSSLPPTFGFLMKLISIQSMSTTMNFIMILILIFSSLISMNFYLKITFNNLMNYYSMNKFNLKIYNFKNIMNFKFTFYNFMLLFMLTIYELV